MFKFEKILIIANQAVRYSDLDLLDSKAPDYSKALYDQLQEDYYPAITQDDVDLYLQNMGHALGGYHESLEGEYTLN